MRPARRDRVADRGSVLLLVPTGVLVVVVLAAIAVDTGVALLGEREAAALAEGAANDAATAAVDEAAYRAGGEFRIDEARARRVVAGTMAATSSELEAVRVEVGFPVVDGQPAVQVTVAGTIDTVFARALPGGPEGFEVEATATAVAAVG
jgi:hypothetical protein